MLVVRKKPDCVNVQLGQFLDHDSRIVCSEEIEIRSRSSGGFPRMVNVFTVSRITAQKTLDSFSLEIA
jgi:hypothetical protein